MPEGCDVRKFWLAVVGFEDGGGHEPGYICGF